MSDCKPDEFMQSFLGRLVESFVATGAVNYLEVNVGSPDYGDFTIFIQRGGKETSAQQNARLREELRSKYGGQEKFYRSSNRVRCRKCNTVIESKSQNDYAQCPCGSVAVDGGPEIFYRTGKAEDFEELSQAGGNG